MMASRTYKIVNVVMIICLILALIGVTAEYLVLKQRYSQIIDVPAQTTDVYILSFNSERVYDNIIKTSLTLENRGGGGLIQIEYTVQKEDGGIEEINLGIKEYYVRGGSNYTFNEVWIVPTDYNYMECKIVKQIILN